MTDPSRCPVCGSESGGLCRRCLVEGLFSEDDEWFELPEVLGEFRLMRRVGRGASGEVWQAYQPGPEREVALKVFLDPKLGGSADRARFMAEAQALGKLDHPGIVPVYASGEDSGFLYIASRWMPGGTLVERKAWDGTKTDLRVLIEMMVRISRAVAHAHRHGLVHRDIKPANVVLDSAGTPFLTDFGIAMAAGSLENGSTSGTPAYMAPEQARGEAVTVAADVYGLGAVMLHLLEGFPAIEKSMLDGVVDADVMAICRKCLEEDVAVRYGSAAELADDLERWLRGEPVLARPVGAGVRVMKWARRRPGMAVLAGVAVISSGVLAGILVVGSEALRWERNHAVGQERLARENAERAEQASADARENAYVSDIYLASRAIEDGQLGVARAMLDRYLPKAGEEDLRGYEWGAYLARCGGDDEQVFSEHTAAVLAVAFSADGEYLASGGVDGKLVVRKMPTGEVVLSLPDGKIPKGPFELPLMTRLMANSPMIRRQILGMKLNPDEVRMRGRPAKLGEVTALAWSPDGKIVASASGGSYLRLWKFPEGSLEGLLPIQEVREVAITEDGKRLVTLSGHRDATKIWVHDLASLEVLHEIGDVRPAFATHGERLAYARISTGMLRVVEMEEMRTLLEWPAGGGISKLAFTRGGEQLVGLSSDGREEFSWRVTDGKRALVEPTQEGVVRGLAAGEGVVVTAGTGQTVVVRDPERLETVRTLRGHEDEIMAVAISPAGGWLASAGKDKTVRLWKQQPLETARKGGQGNGFTVRTHSTDARRWLLDMKDGRAFLGRLSGGMMQLGDGERRQGLAFDGRGERVSTWRQAPGGLMVEWWAVEDGKLLDSRLFPLKVAEPWVMATGAGCLAVTGLGSTVEIFDLETGVKSGELPYPGMEASKLVISPDGGRVAALAWPRMVKVGELGGSWGGLWKLTDGTAGPLVFSPDGKYLVSGNDENRIAVHDSLTGGRVALLAGHRERLERLAFTPDGRTLVSSSTDRTVRLWHVPTWRELGVLSRGEFVTYLGFDQAGEHLLVVPWGRVPRRVPE